MEDVALVAVLAVALATLVGATVQGAIGFGMNLVTVPVLALVVPEALPVTAILLGVPISIAMLRHERAALDRAGIAWLLGGRVPGTFGGVWVVMTVTTVALQLFVASFVLLFVATSVLAPPLPVRRSTQLAAGAVSGVTGTAAGIGGPPVAMLYQHHSGPMLRSTLAASFAAGTVLSLVALAAAGAVARGPLLVGVALAPLVVAGSHLGRRFHGALERRWLRPAVLTFSAVSAVIVIIDAFR